VHAAIAVALVIVAVLARPRLVVGIAVTALLFVPLERAVPLRRRRVLRPGWRTDVVHFVVNNLLSTALLVAGFVVVGLPLRALVPQSWRDAIASMPAGRQFLVALLLAELAQYWAHRATHRVPWLWRFHKVHHSIAEMDWLAAARLHPVDQAFTRLVTITPLLVLGFTRETFGGYLVISSVQAIFIHANVRLRFGPLRWVLATPQFHHWHHANTSDARDTNFAGQLPVLDLLFGTAHVPARAWPARYGVDDALPRGYVAQLAWPWRGVRAPSAF
jgi:sterol desaturase/sphingolipid hydroxylase (fatty acid hydroxylase superfamily)